MLIRTTTVAVLMALLLFPASFVEAKDEQSDAAARFHKAYVDEVIEGMVKEAAVEYLALMNDDATPKKIRGEARFRFAVCTVLLGRSDEGTTQLREIVNDTSLSEALRKRATHYLKGISGASTGNATTRLNQSLVESLAQFDPRVDLEESEAARKAYRSVEIAGDAVVPALKKLLSHRDLDLRRHAFRLLCRVNVDGMIEHFTPNLWKYDGGYPEWDNDVSAYLSRKEGRADAFGRYLLSKGKPGLRAFWLIKRCSIPIIRDFVAAGGHLETALKQLVRHSENEVRGELLAWVDSGDEKLRALALSKLHNYASEATPQIGETYLKELRNVAKGGSFHYKYRLPLLARAAPIAALKSCATELLQYCKKTDAEDTNPLVLPALLTLRGALVERGEDDLPLPALVGVLRKNIDFLQSHNLSNEQNKIYASRPQGVCIKALNELPEAQAVDLAKWIAVQYHQYYWKFLVDVRQVGATKQEVRPTIASARDVNVFLAGFEASARVRGNSGATQWANAYAMNQMIVKANGLNKLIVMEGVSGEAARAWITRIPGVYERHKGSSPVRALEVPLALSLRSIPEDELPKAWLELVMSVPEEQQRQLLTWCKTQHCRPAIEYPESLLLAPKVWDKLNPKQREYVLFRASNIVRNDHSVREGGTEPGVSRDVAAKFILDRVEEIGAGHRSIWSTVASDPVRFPIDSWILSLPSNLASVLPNNGKSERVDAAYESAVRKLMLKQRKVTVPLVQVVERTIGVELAKEVKSSLLRDENSSVRRHAMTRFILTQGRRMVNSDVLRRSLALELASKPTELSALRRVANDLLLTAPGMELVPVAKVLISSEHHWDVRTGIKIAHSLGQPALVPPLRSLLGSLNKDIRSSAKKAIESIRRTQELKGEAKANPPETGVEAPTDK